MGCGSVRPSSAVPGTEMTVPSLHTLPAAVCVKLQLSLPQSHRRLPGLEEWYATLNCSCLSLEVSFCSQTPDSGPHSVPQRAIGWSPCCLFNNRLWCEFVGCVFSEMPQLILSSFFHVCQCPHKFDIFEADYSVLPPSYPEFRTLDPGRTLFRWYLCWILFSLFIAFFVCIDYSDLTHSNADLWMQL